MYKIPLLRHRQLMTRPLKQFCQEAKESVPPRNMRWIKFGIGLGTVGLGINHIYQQQKIVRGLDFHSQEKPSHSNLVGETLQIIQQDPSTLWGSMREKLGILLRMLRMGLFYLPTLLVLPLYMLSPSRFESWLLNALEFGIKNSGSVVIKLAQYGSHRPDIFNENFIKQFQHLRVDAPKHSYAQTQAILKANGLWDDLELLDKEPIASGVIGQVYAAKYKGQKVALKVRHPHVMQKIKQDLKIVFGLSQTLSRLSFFRHLEMPLTINDFMKVLIDQTDFRIENQHLDSFNRNFARMKDQVDFPSSIYASQDVLMESFVEKGESISDFLQKGKIGQNKKLARLGVNCIYKMVIYDNFVHADCHGGNIFVQKIEKKGSGEGIEKEESGEGRWGWEKRVNAFNRWVYNQVNKAQFGVFNGLIMAYNQYSSQGGVAQLQKDYQEMMLQDDSEEYSFTDDVEQYKLVMLDTGMVTQVSPQNHVDLMRLLMSVVIKDQNECCNAVKKIALQVDEAQLEEFKQTMHPTFEHLKDTPLNKINIGQIVQNIILSAQRCHIKFEGNMATLLQNIIVLEGLARQLDPEINIIGQAIPFLVNPSVIQQLILT